MKLILTFLIICCSSALFAQSKRTINKQLSVQLVQAREVYDSLQDGFYVNKAFIKTLKDDISNVDKNLSDQRTEITDLLAEIHVIKNEMLEAGDNPELFVREKELTMIYFLVTQTIYSKDAQKIMDTLQAPSVEYLGDISDKKIKVQNELIQAKITEYKQTYSQFPLLISLQKNDLEKLNRLKTSAKDQLDVAVKMKKKLDEKRILLVAKQEELDQNRSGVNAKAPREKTEPKKEIIVTFADEMPEFPSGMKEALQKYLKDHLIYPQSAIDARIEGKVYIQFVVSASGNIRNVSVIKGIPGCLECDMEAYTVISMMPKWKPAKMKGEPAACYYTLPIVFKLDQ